MNPTFRWIACLRSLGLPSVALGAILASLALSATGCGRCRLAGIVEPTLERRSAARNAAAMRVQALLAEVVERPNQSPRLVRHGYRVDSEYFYPASAIKLCAAVAALQVLEDLPSPTAAPDERTPVRLHPLFPGDATQEGDASNLEGGDITIGHEIRKLCLVSDNRAFNRLYDFVGHDRLNTLMHRAGLASVVINHRLSDPRTIPDQRATAQVDLLTPTAVVTMPPRQSDLVRRTQDIPGLSVGTGFMRADTLVPESMDFSARNRISLRDLQDLLIMIARPDIDIGGGRAIRLSTGHRQLLLDAMTQYPGDSANPIYPRAQYPDGYAKFFLPGLCRVIPKERVRITNKIGQAYGFTTENAYIQDAATGRSFFLTATIYTNADGVLNDDRYEYTTLAEPFMADLAEAVARDLGLK